MPLNLCNPKNLPYYFGGASISTPNTNPKVSGYDFTVSVPPSLSVLWANANKGEQRELEAKIMAASSGAVQVLEKHLGAICLNEQIR